MKPKSIIRLSVIALALLLRPRGPAADGQFQRHEHGRVHLQQHPRHHPGRLARADHLLRLRSRRRLHRPTRQRRRHARCRQRREQRRPASLNHDFAIEANLANKPLTVSFNVDEVSDQMAASSASATPRPTASAPTSHVLAGQRRRGRPRNSAGTGRGGRHSDGDLMTFVFSDTAGTGSAFNGNGSAKVYRHRRWRNARHLHAQPARHGRRLSSPGVARLLRIGLMLMVDNLSVEMDATFPAGETLIWSGASTPTGMKPPPTGAT